MTTNRMLLAGSALAFATLAIPAHAQDAFQGPYVAVFGGLSSPNDRNTDTLVFDTDRDGDYDDDVNTGTGDNAFSPGFCDGPVDGNAPPCGNDGVDAEYGARLGLDMRPGGGPFLVGGLVEVSRAEFTDGTTGFSTTPASYTVARSMDYALSARARAGLVLDESVLLYGTGGVSWAKIDNAFTTTNSANSFTETGDDKMRWGYQYGGGAEFALTDSFTLGMEYMRSSYKDRAYNVEVGPGTAPATNPFLLDDPTGTDLAPSSNRLRAESLRLVAGLRF